MTYLETLQSKIKTSEATIGIVGLGYVGLPLLLRYREIGFKVIGIDIDSDKVSKLKNNISSIEHISGERIKKINQSDKCLFTDNFKFISDCDAIILCVPTPLKGDLEPDLSFVTNTLDSLMPYVKKGQIISLESTTYPGTTDEEIVSRLEHKKFIIGEDYFVVYSPEREDPGNINFSTSNIPKICGGFTKSCLTAGISLYEPAIEKLVPVSSTRTAEMTKLLENIHRAVNIGLVNEMKVIADKMGIDIFEVVDAASTKPFGFTPYYPGPGLGGHCIPIDPFYLTYKAKEYGIHTKFIELAGEINMNMPGYVLDKLVNGLASVKKILRESKILVLGIAYKKNIDDVRESPSVHIMELLKENGAKISYSDPHVSKFPKMRDHEFSLTSVDINKETLRSFDAVILSTDHDAFDYDLILQHCHLIIDARGKFREPNSKVIRA